MSGFAADTAEQADDLDLIAQHSGHPIIRREINALLRPASQVASK